MRANAESAPDEGELKPGEDSAQTMMAASRLSAGQQGRFDPRPLLDKHKLETPEQIVDFFVNHLLSAPLAEEKREQLIGYLRGDKGGFDAGQKDADVRLRMLIHLICSTPEYQMY